MPVQYEVKPGECIGSIAHAHKIAWQRIWNHPKNADLRELRKDPNVLREGDSVFVPDLEQKTVADPTDATHRFVVRRHMARLRLRVVFDPGPKPAPSAPPGPPSGNRRNVSAEDAPAEVARADEPRKALAYELIIDDIPTQGETDDDGYIDREISPDAKNGRLVLAPGTPHETEVTLHLGHLDPIDEVTGVKQRLRNLCFDCGDQSNEETPDLADAVSMFQAKHGLPATGQLDAATRAEILNAHGA